MSAASISFSTSTPIFSGVSYTDAHVTIVGMSFISVALAMGAAIAFACGLLKPRVRWLSGHRSSSGLLCGGRFGRMVCRPSSSSPTSSTASGLTSYRQHRPDAQAYGLDRFAQREFPAETTVAAADPEHNQATLENIRLWDVGALQDTLPRCRRFAPTTIFPASISIATRSTARCGR
jgi:uncharacterized membrane protein (UPF0182 family)